jgi:CubicO group peptidase (beta-lactamase class C family)
MSDIKSTDLTSCFDGLRPQIEGILGSMGVIGASIALSDRNGVLSELNFGRKDKEAEGAPDRETVFMIGSCSKSFAALAVMQLVERGKLSLDDDVSEYTRFTAGKGITIRQLLTHTSGIPNLGMGETLIRRSRDGKTEPWFDSMDQFYDHANGAGDWFFAPGERYIYCNTNYTLAAEVVRRVSGLPYEEYVEREIFRPLQMNRSCFTRERYEQLENKSKQYFQEGREVPAYFEPVIAGCGGILSCAADLSRYLRMFLGEGTLDGVQLIKKDTCRQIKTEFAPMTTAKDLFGSGFGPEYYGLGFMIYPDYCGVKVVTHSGSTGIGSANLFFVPDLGFSLSGVCNVASGESALPLIGFLLTAALRGEDFFERLPYFASEAYLTSLCGEYHSYRAFLKRSVKYKEGMLWLCEGERERPMVPDNTEDVMPTVFRLYNGPQCYFKAVFLPHDRLMLERNLMEKQK